MFKVKVPTTIVVLSTTVMAWRAVIKKKDYGAVKPDARTRVLVHALVFVFMPQCGASCAAAVCRAPCESVPCPLALSLDHVVDAALGDLVHRLLLGAPRRVRDLADARVALALAQRNARVRRVREHVPAHRLLSVWHKPATCEGRPGAAERAVRARPGSGGLGTGERVAQVGVAVQYAAIAPGSAQTWLVRTTARLNCERRGGRTDGSKGVVVSGAG